MRVLIVDDEPRLGAAVARALTEHGVQTTTAQDGVTGFELARTGAFDVVVLDIMLPGKNGYDVCRELRSAGVTTPVLVLTAKDGEYDEADALDLGADDYLRKPFATVVLVARVFALSRREGAARGAELRVGDLVLHEGRRQVTRGVEVLELTGREFALLHELMRRAGDTIGKYELLERVWGQDAWGRDANLVEVYIGYLRRKVDVPFGRRTIATVRGQGYRIDVDG